MNTTTKANIIRAATGALKFKPNHIANLYGLPVNEVRKVLHEAGVPKHPPEDCSARDRRKGAAAMLAEGHSADAVAAVFGTVAT